MSAPEFDDGWSFFDKIYCISLEERADRREHARAQFGRVGLRGRVEFVRVGKHPADCEQGIYESHMGCIRRGLQSGARAILIFEDDILFDRFDPASLTSGVRFISSVPDWNILFLGCLVRSSRRTASAHVLEVRYRSLAHAYALSRRFAEVLIRKPWKGLAFDTMLSEFRHGCYALYPSMAFQSNFSTDNINKLWLDRFRRMWGGLRNIQKMNEFVHCHKRAVICSHVLVGFIILLWILR